MLTEEQYIKAITQAGEELGDAMWTQVFYKDSTEAKAQNFDECAAKVAEGIPYEFAARYSSIASLTDYAMAPVLAGQSYEPFKNAGCNGHTRMRYDPGIVMRMIQVSPIDYVAETLEVNIQDIQQIADMQFAS